MFKPFGNLSPFLGYLSPKAIGFNVEGEAGEGSGSGEGGEDWRAALPAEIKAHPVLQKYKNSNEAVKALVEAQSLIGAEKIIMPSKDATLDEWNERVFNRLGRPDSPDKYELPTNLDIPKELPIDASLTKSFKEVAHKTGMLPNQVKELYTWYMDNLKGAYENMGKAQIVKKQEAETAMRKEYGAAYDQNIALAQKVVGRFADAAAVESLINGKGNDPAMIKMFVNIGKILGEDQLAGKPQGLTLQPAEALVELRKLEADMKGPLYNAAHPEHLAVMAKREALYKMAHPAETE